MLKESDNLVILGRTFVSKMTFEKLLVLFPELLLTGLVSCGSPGNYSMIDCILGDALVFFPARFGVLFCSVVLRCDTHTTGPCSQWFQFLNWECI